MYGVGKSSPSVLSNKMLTREGGLLYIQERLKKRHEKISNPHSSSETRKKGVPIDVSIYKIAATREDQERAKQRAV